MELICHGGHCCGIKTIYGFPWYAANEICGAIPANKESFPANPALSKRDDLYAGKNFFKGPAPEEPATERLDRYIAFVDQYRPSHLIEAVLNQTQKKISEPMLLDKGFKCVSEFTNSNSTSRVYVYHRVTPLPKKKKTEGEV